METQRWLIKRMQSVICIICCSACVYCVEVRPHHAALHAAALVEGAEWTEFKLAVLVYRCLYRMAPSNLADGFTSRLTSRPVSFSALARHHRLSNEPVFNHRRQSFSGCCCLTVEHSDPAEHHVGAVTDFLWNAWRLISSVVPSPISVVPVQ